MQDGGAVFAMVRGRTAFLSVTPKDVVRMARVEEESLIGRRNVGIRAITEG